jgi:chemotaxis protein MotB
MKGVSAMRKVWSVEILVVLLVAALMQGCMVRAIDYRALENKLAVTEASIDEYRDQAAQSRAELETLRTDYDLMKEQLDDKDGRVAELENAPRATPELTRIWESLEALARARKDMDWDPATRKLLVSVEFDLGSAAIKPSGKGAIKQIASIINGMPSGHIAYIDGHTDNLPVKNPRTIEKFGDNPGLAVARALAVYRVLEEGGVPPISMITRGFGEYHPVVQNTNAESRARNRRVEISIVPQATAFTPTATLVPESDVATK